jgi:hypothetical protein
MEKLHGPDPQLMDHSGASPRWTLDRGSAMTSLDLGLTAALGHGGSPALAQQRQRSMGSPSRVSLGCGRRCGDRATVVKKWQSRCSVRAAPGHGEKRRMGRSAVEDSEAGVALTQAQEAVRQPGDDGNAAVSEEIGGGGARARRGEEESEDGCGKDRARASAFYRGQREAGTLGIQWPASIRVLKISVTQSDGGRRFKVALRSHGFNSQPLRVLHGARKREATRRRGGA